MEQGDIVISKIQTLQVLAIWYITVIYSAIKQKAVWYQWISLAIIRIPHITKDHIAMHIILFWT